MDVMKITVHRDGALLHEFNVPQGAQAAIIEAMQSTRPLVEYPKIVRTEDGLELGTAHSKAQENALLRDWEAKRDAA